MESPQSLAWDALMLVKSFELGGPDARDAFLNACRSYLHKSKAQLFQDVFVIRELNAKQNGFFVEFGATNGISLNNTALLEEEFSWSGILAEPARVWKDMIRTSRNCIIDFRCVTDRTGDVMTFNEAAEPEYSTLDQFSSSDYHAERRLSGRRYDVPTVSINDLLNQHGAPRNIDYLSVDTEGSEFTILSSLDLDMYRPRVITVEHNYQEESRRNLYTLLTRNGYQRKYEEFSRWDDWYTLAT